MRNLKRIQNIQALRGIAVISVLVFHLISVERKYGGAHTILPDFFQFGMFGVDLFFVISGFVMVLITQGRFRHPKQSLSFLCSRIIRIYPVYWFYTFLVLIVFLNKPEWVNRIQGNQVNILYSFLLLPAETLPLVFVGWSLIHEMYFYIVFFFIILLIKERYLLLAVVVWALTVVFFNLQVGHSGSFLKLIFHPLTLEFICGCVIAKIYINKKSVFNLKRFHLFAFLCLMASVTGYMIYRYYTFEVEPLGWWRIMIFGIPSVLIVYIYTYAERAGFIFYPILIKIGDASYSIYLSHALTLSALGRIWKTFAIKGISDNIIALPLIFILTLYAGYLSYIIFEKPLMDLSKKFTR